MKSVKNLILTVLAAVACMFVMQPATADTDAYRVVSKVIDVASLADAAGATSTVAVPGAVLGDACLVSAGVDLQGMTVTCYISAADTVSIRVQNESGGTIDLASTTFRVFVHPKGTR